MKINLVQQGVFPIIYDKDGKKLPEGTATGYPVAGTIQGEGKLVGIPVIFIRTSGCNLRCSWQTGNGEVSICDTPYSSHRVEKVEIWEVDDIIATLKKNLGPVQHVVISGGEPTIQPEPLKELVRKLKRQLRLHITIETNGITYVPEIMQFADMISLSPKLRSSDPTKAKNKQLDHPVDEQYLEEHPRTRRNLTVLQKYINECMVLSSYYEDDPGFAPERRRDKDFQLKFVISKAEEEEEIRKDFLDHLSFVEKKDVVLMPVGGTRDFLRNSDHMTAAMAIRNGWRYTPRLHIDLWNDQQYV